MSEIMAYSEITILDLIDTATYIYYANDDKGTGVTSAPTSTSKYIGIYSGPPFEGFPNKFPMDNWQEEWWSGWSKYVGENGQDGQDGMGFYKLETHIRTNSQTGWNEWYNRSEITWDQCSNTNLKIGDSAWLAGTIADRNNINCMFIGTVKAIVPQENNKFGITVTPTSFIVGEKGEDGQDAEAYDIETNQNEVFKFVSNYNEDGTNWIFSPSFLEIKVFKRPRDTESQPLNLTANNIEVKIIGYSESLMEYVTIGGLSTEEEGQSNVAIFNIQNAYVEGSSELVSLFNSTQGQFKIIYKDDQGKEIANKIINYSNGTTDDMAKFSLNAADINMAIGSTKLVFDINGLTIHDGGFRIFKDNTTDEASKVLFADEQGNLHLKGIVEASGGSFTGTIHATNGEFTGTVDAKSGKIGGFIIEEDKITSTDNSLIFTSSNEETGARSSIYVQSITLGDGVQIEDKIQLGEYSSIQNPEKNEGLFISTKGLRIYDEGKITLGKIELYSDSENTSYIKQIDNKWEIRGDGTAIFKDVIADNVLLQDTILQIGTVQSVGSLMLFKDSWKVKQVNGQNIQVEGIASLEQNDWIYSGENVYKVKEKSVYNSQTDTTEIILNNNFNSTEFVITKFGIARTEANSNSNQPGFVISIFGQGSEYENYGNRNFASPNSFTISDFREEGSELKYTKRLILGSLNDISKNDITYEGTLSGVGLYADNVFLNGSLTTQINAGSYAGINTISGQTANKFENQDTSKIVFWAGASDNNTTDAPFQVTENGSIYASRGRFTSSVISDSEIQGADIYAARIHGGKIGEAAALTIYDTGENTGVSFRTGYNSAAEQPSGIETLYINSYGFRRTQGAEPFIGLIDDNGNNTITFKGDKFSTNAGLNIESNIIYGSEVQIKNSDKTESFMTINSGNVIISSAATQITGNLTLKGSNGGEIQYQPANNGQGYDLYV